MRYVRVTISMNSPARAGDGTFSARLNYPATGKMLYCTWRDGDLLAVPDNEAGAFGGPTDNFYDILSDPPYPMFQLTLPALAPEALAAIPLWTAHLRPYDANPAVQPTVWPALQVVVGNP